MGKWVALVPIELHLQKQAVSWVWLRVLVENCLMPLTASFLPSFILNDILQTMRGLKSNTHGFLEV